MNGSQPRGGSKEGRQLLAFHFSVSEKVGKEENTGFRGHLFLLSFLSNPTPKPTSMSCYFLKNKLGTRSPLATFSATTENKPFWAAPTHETAKPPLYFGPCSLSLSAQPPERACQARHHQPGGDTFLLKALHTNLTQTRREQKTESFPIYSLKLTLFSRLSQRSTK